MHRSFGVSYPTQFWQSTILIASCGANSVLGNQTRVEPIPNGCFDAYEVKVNKDIFKYQEKVKLISQFQRFFLFFNGLLEFASFP